MTRVLVLIVASLLTLTGSVHAGPIHVNDTVRLADGPGTTGGGEFVMTVEGTWSFITFCLQRTEYIDFSTNFVVGGINTYTLTDPVSKGGDSLGRDPISAQTAFLYTKFRQGVLAGYDYTGSSHTLSANRLQNAFWMFENELAMDLSNPFVAMANQAVSSGLWSGIGEVRVLNLYFPNNAEAQDQLALVSLPEPSSLLLLASGVSLAVARRLRRRSTRVVG